MFMVESWRGNRWASAKSHSESLWRLSVSSSPFMVVLIYLESEKWPPLSIGNILLGFLKNKCSGLPAVASASSCVSTVMPNSHWFCTFCGVVRMVFCDFWFLGVEWVCTVCAVQWLPSEFHCKKCTMPSAIHTDWSVWRPQTNWTELQEKSMFIFHNAERPPTSFQNCAFERNQLEQNFRIKRGRLEQRNEDVRDSAWRGTTTTKKKQGFTLNLYTHQKWKFPSERYWQTAPCSYPGAVAAIDNEKSADS